MNVAILESFDLQDAALPVSILESELPKHLDRLVDIHPNRMEDLVARILAGIHHCEVKQLGYTRDGGIDLILLNSDRPVAVQVKRRRAARVEAVGPIREFLGAAILGGFRELLYVSTAEKFSPAATDAAKAAAALGAVTNFELLNLADLQAMLSTVAKPAWLNALGEVAKKRRSFVKVPDPFQFVEHIH